jgi:hypothetical protein
MIDGYRSRTILGQASETLNLNRISLKVFADNPRAIQTLKNADCPGKVACIRGYSPLEHLGMWC